LQFTGGPSSGTDYIVLRAFNGAWSNWTVATLTDVGGSHAVSASAADSTVNAGGVGLSPAADAVVGFDDGMGLRNPLTIEAATESFLRSSLVSGGQNAPIAVDRGSTMLLSGVNHIAGSFLG
jgi:hypothetical protein